MLGEAVLPETVVSGRRKPLHATLAARLKAARTARGLKLLPLSGLAGVADRTIAKIETEETTPAIDTTEKIARALEVSPCYLAYGVEGAALAQLAEGEQLRAAGCGARIRQLREHQELSLRALASAAGLAGPTIASIEVGATLPTVATAEALAVALGCSPCWLAYAEGPDPLLDPQGAAAELQAVRWRPPRSPRKPPAPRRRRG